MGHLPKNDQPDILTQPPGLLFGLTLLIFLVSKLCFSMNLDIPSPSADVKAELDVVTPGQVQGGIGARSE